VSFRLSHLFTLRARPGPARSQRQTEAELSREIAFRRAMENSMPTGMRVIDLEGRISYVNPAFCRLVGMTQDELLGQTPPYSYWPPEQLEQHRLNIKRLLQGEIKSLNTQIPVMHRDGTRLICRMYTSPLEDAQGKQVGWMTSVTDITEPSRIRLELAQAQERFITVLQSLDASVSVAAQAPDEELLFANEAYRKWFGTSLQAGHRPMADAHRAPWSDGREYFHEQVARWFDVRVRSIQWVDGRVVQLLVATDITQKRIADENQRLQYERLQQTSRLINMGEMASSLAHELNQPLTAINNYLMGAVARIRSAENRQETVAADDLIEMLTKTAKQAERAGTVIQRIRGFVKRSDPIRKFIDPAALVAEAVGLAEIDGRALGVQVLQELDPDLPSINVDPILIEQVLVNLVKNGIDAMRDASIKVLRVRVRIAENQILFSVKDRGHGVDPSMRDRLFDSFYTTKTEGMGMGLNICRSIIESHQGRLWFEDNADGGSTFKFSLPLEPDEPIQVLNGEAV
jgi:PAS domain S-box-containing protein